MPPDDIKSTSALLRAISNASAARHRRSLSFFPQREEEGLSLCCEAYRKKEDVFKAAQLRDMQENLEEEEEEEAEIEAKAKIARLHKKSLEEWHMKRYKLSLKNQLSRAQVDDAVLRLIDDYYLHHHHHHHHHHHFPCTSTLPPPSSTSSDKDPLSILGDTILALWNANQTRIRSALPRYHEGFPIRERIRPPVLRPRRRQKPSGLGDCLQCLAKGLPCSMSVQTKGTGEAVLRGGCRRCVAEGERCIIEHEVVEDVHDGDDDDDDEKGVKKKKGGYGDGKGREGEESGLWDWWDGVPDREQDVDSAAEVVEMWERRRKGMRLEVMGSSVSWS
ncbi:hypothetical protein V8C26DRAFT_435549 [Trichoderma gracile]